MLKPPSFSSKIFPPKSNNPPKLCFTTSPINARKSSSAEVVPVSPEDDSKIEEELQKLHVLQQVGNVSGGIWSKPMIKRKTKIVCTIGPSTNTKEMIWKLAEAGMNVARMNMSHVIMLLIRKLLIW